MAQFGHQAHSRLLEFHRLTKVDDKGVGSLFRWRRDLLFLQFRNDTFHACPKANPRRRRAAEYFSQAIVAPTAVQRQFVDFGCELEDRARIVVKTAYDQRIKRKGHVIQLQKMLDRGKMFAARLAQVIRNLWRSLDLLLILWIFAVQQA